MTLPAAPDAEKVILGAILNDGDLVLEVDLTEADFSVEYHKRVWTACSQIGRAASMVAVADFWGRDELERNGGLSALMDLTEGLPSLVPETVAHFVQRIKRATTLRRLYTMAYDVAQSANSGADPAALLAQVEGAVSRLSTYGGANRLALRRAGEILTEGWEDFCDPSEAIKNGVWLPWRTTRSLIPALLPGQLIILAARPAVGKSAMAFQIAFETARRGLPVACYSLEMPSLQILARLALGESNTPPHIWRRGNLTTTQLREFQRAAAGLGSLPLWMNDSTGITAGQIVATIKRLEEKPRLVVVDYLQLLGGKGENRNQEISGITRLLKRAAMELDIPFLVLSQLSRDSARAAQEPNLHDLRDSGSIEQDADIVAMLHPAGDDAEPQVRDTKLLIRKNRNGACGTVRMEFWKRRTMFTDHPEELAKLDAIEPRVEVLI